MSLPSKPNKRSETCFSTQELVSLQPKKNPKWLLNGDLVGKANSNYFPLFMSKMTGSIQNFHGCLSAYKTSRQSPDIFQWYWECYSESITNLTSPICSFNVYLPAYKKNNTHNYLTSLFQSTLGMRRYAWH